MALMGFRIKDYIDELLFPRKHNIIDPSKDIFQEPETIPEILNKLDLTEDEYYKALSMLQPKCDFDPSRSYFLLGSARRQKSAWVNPKILCADSLFQTRAHSSRHRKREFIQDAECCCFE